MLCFDKCFQAGQVRTPESAIGFQPSVYCFQWLRIQAINAVSAFATLLHQMRPAQQSQVFGDCRPRDRKSPSDTPSRLATLT